MHFNGPVETRNLNFINVPYCEPNLRAIKPGFRKERTRYIHRCPFSHCPHQESRNNIVIPTPHKESEARKIKASLPPLGSTQKLYGKEWPTRDRGNDEKDGHLTPRGPASLQVTSQDRHRAILYMLNRIKVTKNLTAGNQHRLLESILSLEQKVFDDSATKEKYLENLAAKLFLIFQELARRRRAEPSGGTTPYSEFSASTQ